MKIKQEVINRTFYRCKYIPSSPLQISPALRATLLIDSIFLHEPLCYIFKAKLLHRNFDFTSISVKYPELKIKKNHTF